jgi:uncharacterized protein (DUF427 family)
MRRRPTPDPLGPGQESVWDYPRPPRVEPTDRHVVVEFDGMTIVDTRAAVRVLETSHPPVFYVPIDAVAAGVLQPNARRTFCEFKGTAAYHDVVGPSGRIEVAAAWSYPEPTPGFELLAGRVALYPGRMDRCLVDGEVVRAVQGDFYGGWVTSDVVGPFKGAVAGSQWW